MPRQAPAALSKSKYLSGLQCVKRLWTEVHAPELVPKIDAATQALFDQGHEVGRLATGLFPGGFEIGSGATRRWEALVEATRRALSQRRPLYEAAFRHGGAACRVDILVPADDRRWDLFEVKSSTGVKDVHLEDIAFQSWVVEGAGLPVKDYYLVHIDNTYVRRGELDLAGLFRRVRVSEQVRARQALVADQLAAMRSGLAVDRRPEVPIGPRCDSPHECPLKSACWAFLPPVSVFDLVAAGQKAFQLMERGILELGDIPADEPLTEKQRLQLDAYRSGEPHVRRGALRVFLQALEYPIYFFDVETFAPAIPLFDGSRPYQQIPFLFSVRRIERPGEKARHYAYLVPGEGDPRPEFLRAARSSLDEEGSIVAYNAAFERRVVSEAADAIPGFTDWATRLSDRFQDLLLPFRAFDYYHPDQLRHASLKAVLPTLTDLNYGDLSIAEGETASREYLRVTYGDVEPVERIRVLRQLRQYCALDTLGMVAIVKRLQELAG